MRYNVTDGEGSEVEGETMLEVVGFANVFDLRRMETEEEVLFVLEESCDNYYDIKMTREQLVALGNELIAFAEKE
jgi:hypothetical protein